MVARTRRWLLLLLALSCAGCRGTPVEALGSGSVSGTLAGMSMQVQGAWAGTGQLAANPTREVLLASSASVCGDLASAVFPPTLQTLHFDLFSVTTTGWTPAGSPGAYMVVSNDPTSPGPYAAVLFEAWVADHSTTTPILGTAGSVTVQAISSQSVAGTFDVTLATGEHITGRFDAPQCNALVCPVATDGAFFPCL